MSTCVAIVPGCRDCTEQVGRGEHVCDDLCSFDGEQKRASEEYHRRWHTPRRCVGCGSVLNDRKGNDRTVTKSCPEGCCRLWCCPDCDAAYAWDGPVGCPSCSPIERTDFAQGVAANAERMALMTRDDIDRTLDDLEDRP